MSNLTATCFAQNQKKATPLVCDTATLEAVKIYEIVENRCGNALYVT